MQFPDLPTQMFNVTSNPFGTFGSEAPFGCFGFPQYPMFVNYGYVPAFLPIGNDLGLTNVPESTFSTASGPYALFPGTEFGLDSDDSIFSLFSSQESGSIPDSDTFPSLQSYTF